MLRAKLKKKNKQNQKLLNALIKKAGTIAIAKHPKPKANNPF